VDAAEREPDKHSYQFIPRQPAGRPPSPASVCIGRKHIAQHEIPIAARGADALLSNREPVNRTPRPRTIADRA